MTDGYESTKSIAEKHKLKEHAVKQEEPQRKKERQMKLLAKESLSKPIYLATTAAEIPKVNCSSDF